MGGCLKSLVERVTFQTTLKNIERICNFNRIRQIVPNSRRSYCMNRNFSLHWSLRGHRWAALGCSGTTWNVTLLTEWHCICPHRYCNFFVNTQIVKYLLVFFNNIIDYVVNLKSPNEKGTLFLVHFAWGGSWGGRARARGAAAPPAPMLALPMIWILDQKENFENRWLWLPLNVRTTTTTETAATGGCLHGSTRN